ncbi:MAG: diguanylate cyclase, partial [Campylobacterota bacterium]|nr:diguanylate cyclase [Campylobacterota bacterium]
FLFLDIDNFKIINDSLGHHVGDELLKRISSTINEALRANDFVARVGGDEFVIIIENYNSLVELTKIVDRIQKHISQIWAIQTHLLNVESSIGIAFYPKDGDNLISLMKNSDIAMYEAKSNGRARYHFFTEELNKRVQDNITLDKDMRKALEDDEYQLYYQPKVSLKSGKIVGVEALIRWVSPTRGMIVPDTFIPLAEENGFIVKLGWWVVEESIRQHNLWRDKNIDVIISINVSAKQLLAEGFITDFKRLLEENRVEPSKIDIEITEYLFLQNSERNSQTLQELHDFGVTISLDDFGTGYSSLSYLKKFPIDNLKIDKAFIDDYDSIKGSIFIETIVKMGQTLNMKVVAEGTELKEQIEYLKAIGCDQYQGYYFSKPLNSDDFEALFLKQKQTVNAI